MGEGRTVARRANASLPSSSLQASLLRLQSTAGNRAVAAHLAATRRAPVLQRDVGFEFELGEVSTYTKDQTGKGIPLHKKDKIVKRGDVDLEADEMPGYADVEFVTKAFPETAAGATRLADAVREVASMTGKLSKLERNKETKARSAISGATKGVFFSRASPLFGKPQASAGLKLDALDRLFQDVATREGSPGQSNRAATMFGGQVSKAGTRAVDKATTGMLDVAQARSAAQSAIKNFNRLAVNGPEITALVTQLVMYLVAGAKGLDGYAKMISGGFLARNNFATMFVLLPVGVYNTFVPYNARLFSQLVLGAAQDAGSAAGLREPIRGDGSIFEGGIYNSRAMFGRDPKFQSRMPHLGRRDWLEKIVGGTDDLTGANFPGDEPARAELESLGSYEKMDVLPNGRSAPIFEFRGLKPIEVSLFGPLAFDLFRYVHTLNAEGYEGYPGGLLEMPPEDRATLTGSGRKAMKMRERVITDAMQSVAKWGV